LIAIVLLATPAAYGQGRLEGGGPATRFVSEKYGFFIAVPPGWLVDPSKDTPRFVSFSPVEAQDFNHQLKLPKGGAVISVVAEESLVGRHFRGLFERAAADARGDSDKSPMGISAKELCGSLALPRP
jgi:hypothetical protein